MVYQALYGDKSLYVRPLEMFLEKVDRTPYPNLSQTYRFEKVSHLSKQDMFLAYIQAWLDNDSRYLSDWFSDDICYRECYGPEYHGIEQLKQWFSDWQQEGRVLEWQVSNMMEVGDKLVAEWHFSSQYKKDRGSFNGVSVVTFYEGKITKLVEYQSSDAVVFPYGE